MLASGALVHRKLESDFSAKAAERTTETERRETTVFCAASAFVYSRSYFSVFINNTSTHFKAAAFTVFLNAFGRCVSPSVIVLLS